MTRDTRLKRSTTTQQAIRRRTTSRRGFSLIEIILATAVLLGSVMVLSELAAIGRRQAQRARDLTRAQQLCTQQLNAMLVGLQPLKPVSHRPIPDPQQLLSQQPTPNDSPDNRRPSETVNISDENRSPRPTSQSSAKQQALAPQWLYSVSLQPLHNIAGMSALNVTVSQARPVNGRRPVAFRLTRWIHDQPPTTSEKQATAHPLDQLSAKHQEYDSPFGSPRRP